jgi:hypothetical protein
VSLRRRVALDLATLAVLTPVYLLVTPYRPVWLDAGWVSRPSLSSWRRRATHANESGSRRRRATRAPVSLDAAHARRHVIRRVAPRDRRDHTFE